MTEAGQKNHGSYYELYRMAGATEISIDAAIKAVLSGLDGILLLVDLKAFCGQQCIFTLLPTHCGSCSVKHCV